MANVASRGAAPANGDTAAPVQLRPFIAGSRRIDEVDYDQTQALGAATVQLQTWNVTPTGYVRAIHLLVEGTAVNTTASTVAYQEDGPFNVLQTVLLQDTNSNPLVGPLSGYDLYLINKYGGYTFMGDARNSTSYSATTGTGTTAGTFAFALQLPFEAVQRDSFGTLQNMSGATTFTVQLTVNTLGAVYSDDPTTSVSVRVRGVVTSWQKPQATDAIGRPINQSPPALGATQFWTKQSYNSLADFQNVRLQNIDGMVRSMILINRRASSTRANGATDFPLAFTFKYEGLNQFEARPRLLWLTWISQMYGYSAAAEAANGIDSGVFPIWEYMTDWGLKPGDESRYNYLPVTSASNLEFSGTWGPSQTDNLTLLHNRVVPLGAQGLRAFTTA